MSRDDFDDAWRLRRDDAEAADDADGARDDTDTGAPCFLGTFVSGGAPGAVAVVQPCYVTGAETGGGAGTVAASAAPTVPVLNVGTATPPAGTQLICTYVPYRWVTQYDG